MCLNLMQLDVILGAIANDNGPLLIDFGHIASDQPTIIEFIRCIDLEILLTQRRRVSFYICKINAEFLACLALWLIMVDPCWPWRVHSCRRNYLPKKHETIRNEESKMNPMMCRCSSDRWWMMDGLPFIPWNHCDENIKAGAAYRNL